MRRRSCGRLFCLPIARAQWYNQRVARERVYRTEAVVLKRRDQGEADRILTIFTPGLGKLRVNAKGARKPSSRKSGHVELFARINLQLAKGRALDIVTQAETLEAFAPIRESLERTGAAYYLVELTERFTQEADENLALYNLLLETLRALTVSPDLLLTLRFFELRLLSCAGYQPQLHLCVQGDEEIEPPFVPPNLPV
mgnify:FL=1